MHRVKHRLGLSDCQRFKRCFSPGNFHRKSGKVDAASVAGVATQIVRRSHENTIDRTGLHAQSAKQAFSVIDDELGQLEALLLRRLLLADFNAIGRTGPDTGLASDAGRQIKTMVAAKTRGHGHRKFRKFVLLREGPPLGDRKSESNSAGPPKGRDETVATAIQILRNQFSMGRGFFQKRERTTSELRVNVYYNGNRSRRLQWATRICRKVIGSPTTYNAMFWHRPRSASHMANPREARDRRTLGNMCEEKTKNCQKTKIYPRIT